MSQGFTLAVLDGCECFRQSLRNSGIECAALGKSLSVLGHHTHHKLSSVFSKYLCWRTSRSSAAAMHCWCCVVSVCYTAMHCQTAPATALSSCGRSFVCYLFIVDAVHVCPCSSRQQWINPCGMLCWLLDPMNSQQDCTQAWLGSDHILHAQSLYGIVFSLRIDF